MDTVQVIRAILESRGWQVHAVDATHAGSELVDVKKDGLMKCVDGRASDHTGDAMHGPKTLGGIYAIATMRNVTDAEGLAAIVKEVEDAGYVPSVHGDGSGSMGCGYFKLWSQGRLKGLIPPNFSSEQGVDAVRDAGGTYEVLEGSHYECQVVINLVAGKTLVPNHHDQRFIVDGWVLGEFGLDAATYVTLAASTVEQLSTTCRSARIIYSAAPQTQSKVES